MNNGDQLAPNNFQSLIKEDLMKLVHQKNSTGGIQLS
jgi:hypothetical protein